MLGFLCDVYRLRGWRTCLDEANEGTDSASRRARARRGRAWHGRPDRALYAKFGSTQNGPRTLEICSTDCAARRLAAHRGRVRPQSSCELSMAAAADIDEQRSRSRGTSCSCYLRGPPPRREQAATRRTSTTSHAPRAAQRSPRCLHGKVEMVGKASG